MKKLKSFLLYRVLNFFQILSFSLPYLPAALIIYIQNYQKLLFVPFSYIFYIYLFSILYNIQYIVNYTYHNSQTMSINKQKYIHYTASKKHK